MKFFLDAHLPPSLAPWLEEKFGIQSFSFDFMGWWYKNDEEVFFLARTEDAVVMTKDDDFINLLHKHKAPPKIIWLTCGNTSKEKLKELLIKLLPQALTLLKENDLVEISG